MFDDAVDIYFARQQVGERLNVVRDALPDEAETQIGPISTGLGEIYMWTVEYAHAHGRGANVVDGGAGWQSDGSYLTPDGEYLRTEQEQASYLRTVQDWIIRPQLSGVYHVAADPISKYELLKLVAAEYGKKIAVTPDERVAIDRSLVAERFRAATGYTAPSWRDLVRRMREHRFGLVRL